MNDFSFVWEEPTSLAAELSKPLRRVSVQFASHGWPMYITLWRFDGTGLRLHSEMHDVAERIEVGVLNFSYVFVPAVDETVVDIDVAFGCQLAVSKLIIHESGTNAESGVILEASNGDQIVIVPNAFPCHLAIRGVPSIPNIFEPEYPVDRYTRVPIA